MPGAWSAVGLHFPLRCQSLPRSVSSLGRWLYLGVSFLLLETVRRVTGQQYPQEGAAARVTLHSNMPPSPENGPQVLSENLEGGAGSGERSVP